MKLTFYCSSLVLWQIARLWWFSLIKIAYFEINKDRWILFKTAFLFSKTFQTSELPKDIGGRLAVQKNRTLKSLLKIYYFWRKFLSLREHLHSHNSRIRNESEIFKCMWSIPWTIYNRPPLPLSSTYLFKLASYLMERKIYIQVMTQEPKGMVGWSAVVWERAMYQNTA